MNEMFFITLHRVVPPHNDILIKLGHIDAIEEDKGHAAIWVSGADMPFQVLESLNEVTEYIRDISNTL